MSPLPVSVVVVSRHRPGALLRCLAGLAQSDHPAVEAVVVACPDGVAAVRGAGLGAAVKLAGFDAANISAARNIGLGLAAADLVGFLDDDAVPEPTWAGRIAAPFADPLVAAAGGFVRGRNGISFQWRGAEVDALGYDHPFEAGATLVRGGTAVRALKTQGTCCGFRRAALLAAGGFDPALRFFLDEADVNLRLAAAGHLTALVPSAQVHHGYAASARRRADRVPRDLHEIGAGLAVFLRRHAPEADHAARIAGFREGARRGLVGHMVAGRIEPGAVAPLLGGFDEGVRAGMARDLPALAPLAATPPPFLPLPGTGPRPGALVAGLSRTRLEARARALRAEGHVVTLLHLRPGLRPHRMRFRPDGIWEQAGGLWGRTERDHAWLRLREVAPARRAAAEAARLAPFRPVERVEVV